MRLITPHKTRKIFITSNVRWKRGKFWTFKKVQQVDELMLNWCCQNLSFTWLILKKKKRRHFCQTSNKIRFKLGNETILIKSTMKSIVELQYCSKFVIYYNKTEKRVIPITTKKHRNLVSKQQNCVVSKYICGTFYISFSSLLNIYTNIFIIHRLFQCFVNEYCVAISVMPFAPNLNTQNPIQVNILILWLLWSDFDARVSKRIRKKGKNIKRHKINSPK